MIYDYTIITGKGEQLNLADYRGKVILVVNTATGCGFTPQYAPIEQLYRDYHDKGLEILDIPCNQFGGQAPGSDEEIHEFCTMHFNTTFPQMKKAEVNGENELPLYTYLKSQKGSASTSTRRFWKRCSPKPIQTGPKSRISSGTSPSSSLTGMATWSHASSRPPTWRKWKPASKRCCNRFYILSRKSPAGSS